MQLPPSSPLPSNPPCHAPFPVTISFLAIGTTVSIARCFSFSLGEMTALSLIAYTTRSSATVAPMIIAPKSSHVSDLSGVWSHHNPLAPLQHTPIQFRPAWRHGCTRNQMLECETPPQTW